MRKLVLAIVASFALGALVPSALLARPRSLAGVDAVIEEQRAKGVPKDFGSGHKDRTLLVVTGLFLLAAGSLWLGLRDARDRDKKHR